MAILLVLAGHVAKNLDGIAEPTRGWLMAFANSSAGVRLFFVLSGYLITTLLLEEYARTSQISLRRFYWRRALRILPAFYFFLFTLVLIDSWRAIGLTRPALVLAGTFTWNYGLRWLPPTPDGHWYLGHLWTLALEQQFYLIWPLVLVLLTPLRSLWFAVALIVWCPVARVTTYFLFPAQRGYVGMMLHTALDSIMVGCVAAIIISLPTVRSRIVRSAPFIAAVALGWLLVLSPLLGRLARGSPIAIGFTIDAFAAASLILALHHGRESVIKSIFRLRALAGLGAISYSLYLWQQLFLTPSGLRGPLDIVARLVAACAVAAFSFWCIEIPALRLKRLLSPLEQKRPG